MDEFTIGEVARQAGVRPSAIRFYESIGVLPSPGRVNGRRRYDAEVLSALTIIQVAQRAGFSMAEIKTLFTGFAPGTPASERWHALAGRKLEEVTAQIEQLQAMQKRWKRPCSAAAWSSASARHSARVGTLRALSTTSINIFDRCNFGGHPQLRPSSSAVGRPLHPFGRTRKLGDTPKPPAGCSPCTSLPISDFGDTPKPRQGDPCTPCWDGERPCISSRRLAHNLPLPQRQLPNKRR